MNILKKHLEADNKHLLEQNAQLSDEIERLRAENEKMANRLRNPELTWAENSRLRAENAELKECADAAITDKFREIAKVERLRVENTELREDNAQLRTICTIQSKWNTEAKADAADQS